jgi:RNA polymerase sigma factor (sigma-70 family)
LDIDEGTYKEWRRTAQRAALKAGAQDAWLDDIADEAIEKLLGQDQQPENPNAWVYKVATNIARERHRKEPTEGWAEMPRTNPNREARQKPYPGGLQIPARTGDVRRSMQVAQVMALLNAKERALLAGQAAGRPHSELAREFETSAAVIKTTIARARRKIREKFPDIEDFDI